MDKKIIHEHKKMKRSFEEQRREQDKRLAVLEYREAERKKWVARLKLALSAIPAILSVIALLRTF